MRAKGAYIYVTAYQTGIGIGTVRSNGNRRWCDGSERKGYVYLSY